MPVLTLPSDGSVTYFDPRTDTAELFGEGFHAEAQPEFRDLFYSTFMQQQVPGRPAMESTPEARFNAVACPLLFEATLIFFDGIPAENQIPSSARKLPYQKKLTIPLGAVVKTLDDEAFMSQVGGYTYCGQHKDMLASSSKSCNCCGKAAGGFVVDIFMKMPDDPSKLVSTGPTVVADPVFPVCDDRDCNRKLQEFALRCNKGRAPEGGFDAGMGAALDTSTTAFIKCGYEKCKVDPSTAKLQSCSRCKMRYYCSREHQKADWKEHKKICKPA